MHTMHSTYDRYYAYCSYADIRNFSYYSSTTRVLGSTSYVVGRRLYEWMAGSWIFENEENTRFFFSVRHEDISSPITPPDNVDLELDKMA